MSSDMQCEKLEKRVHEILDRRESPSIDPAVAAHVSECVQCAEFVTACEAMLDGVNALPIPEPSGRFLEGVLEGVTETKQSAGRWPAMAASLAVAASLLVAVTFWWSGRQPGPSGQDAIAVTTPNQLPPAAIAQFPSDPFQTDRIQAVCLTTGRSIAILPRTVRRVAASPGSSNLAGKIRPITQPMGVALEILKRTLPAGAERDPEADGNTGWIHTPGALVVSYGYKANSATNASTSCSPLSSLENRFPVGDSIG